ncbi:MAG: SsrA-binding protein SmpB [Spirochaetales bacterium]|jgi:SsrA-binding protein|nr:SsrA-binding protein SmpB [Spirochaetales bacterium]
MAKKSPPDKTGQNRSLAENRKARHLYTILDHLEVGIELKGAEVKSMRGAQFSFSDAYGRIEKDELFLVGLHINPYAFSTLFNLDPNRRRRLLAHRGEIRRLRRKVDEKGITLIPLRFYLKNGLVKLDLGLCLGKTQGDKRDALKQKDDQRRMERELRDSR